MVSAGGMSIDLSIYLSINSTELFSSFHFCRIYYRANDRITVSISICVIYLSMYLSMSIAVVRFKRKEDAESARDGIASFAIKKDRGLALSLYSISI
jgi:hypothetical protein